MLGKPRYENGNGDEVFLGHYHHYDLYFDTKMKIPSIIESDHTGQKCAIFLVENVIDSKDIHYPLKMAYDLEENWDIIYVCVIIYITRKCKFRNTKI